MGIIKNNQQEVIIREKAPAWTGASTAQPGKRARAKKHTGDEGVVRTRLSCINCKAQKRKCNRLTADSICAYCESHSLACLKRQKSFQGFRKDLHKPDGNAIDPITQHNEEILSQLPPDERRRDAEKKAKLARKKRRVVA